MNVYAVELQHDHEHTESYWLQRTYSPFVRYNDTRIRRPIRHRNC